MKFSSSNGKPKQEIIVVPTINKDLFEDEPVSMCLCVEKQSNIIRRNSSNYLRPKPIHNRANNKYFENNIVKQQNKYLGSQFINRAKLIQKSATSVMNSFAGTVMTTNRSSEIIIPE